MAQDEGGEVMGDEPKPLFTLTAKELLATEFPEDELEDYGTRVDVAPASEPKSALEVDKQGFFVFHRWGIWRLTVCPDTGFIVLDEPGYWISEDRWDEPDWIEHMGRKSWCREHMADFVAALTFCRSLTKKEKATIAAFAKLARKFNRHAIEGE